MYLKQKIQKYKKLKSMARFLKQINNNNNKNRLKSYAQLPVKKLDIYTSFQYSLVYVSSYSGCVSIHNQRSVQLTLTML